MDNFTYESQGTETMLVYHLGLEEHIDSFAKGMLQSNEMVGLLRPSFLQRDMDQFLKFPVTSRIPLNLFLSKEMEREAVLKLCQSIADAVKEMEEYMLSPEKLILDPEYIFVDIHKKEAGLIYLPVDEFTQDRDIKEFLLNMLSHMRFQMDGDVSYVAKLIHFLNQPKPWGFEELKRYIENVMAEGTELKKHSGRREVLGSEKNAVPEGRVNLGEPMAPASRVTSAEYMASSGCVAPAEYMAPAGGANPVEQVVPAGRVNPEDIAPPLMESTPHYNPEPLERPTDKKKGSEKKGGWLGRKEKKEKPPVMPAAPAIPAMPNMAVPNMPAPNMPAPNMAVPGMEIPVMDPPVVRPSAVNAPVLDRQEFGKPAENQEQADTKKKGLFHFGKKKKEGGMPPIQKTPVAPASMQVSPAPKNPELPPIYTGNGSSDDDNRTVIMGGGNDYDHSTVILGGGNAGQRQEPMHHVVRITRRRTGQSMTVNKDVFRIGREDSFVDFYIGDNGAIGACHAEIFEKDGCYYIIDRNSLNHTFVNGIMVQPMESVQLSSGGVITLADEDFDFIIS